MERMGADMALRAYKYFRLYVTKNSGTSAGYVSVNEFRLYGEADHSGVDLCQGATVTSDSQYTADTNPSKAVDGDAATFWESSSGTSPHWIRVELSEASQVRSFYLSSTAYSGEVPTDFSVQGSDDGVEWADVVAIKGWTAESTVKSGYERIDLFVGGTSVLDTGGRALKVVVFDWLTYGVLGVVIPNTAGAWSFQLRAPADVMVTHIGPAGFQPVTDGPITPFEG